MTEQELTEKLVIGARIKIGKEYADFMGPDFQEGQIIELIEGSFERDNGLYTETEYAPAIWIDDEFESIYHLFGNNFEDFKDCEIV